MMTRRQAALAFTAALTGLRAEDKSGPDRVRFVRVPDGGLQPQAALDGQGRLHLVYFGGDPKNGDIFYVTSRDGGATFSSPLRVNTQSGSAIALGTIRGAQLALGRGGRPHVAWNGSGVAEPKGSVNPDANTAGSPMLYARLNEAGTAFEPQRNVMHDSFGLDGGGSVAADRAGHVYVAWHGIGLSEAHGQLQGEARRQVWLARSDDDGRSFAADDKAWSRPTGACGCCGMKIFATRQGQVLALYRSATESVHRDIWLIESADYGHSFHGGLIHKWDINACPMSSMDIAESGSELIGAWETAGQVYWARLTRDGNIAGTPIAAPGEGKGRKHPRIAIAPSGQILLVWTAGTGWQKGGSLAWQIFEASGQPLTDQRQVPGIPAWSFAAPVALPDNRFVIVS